MENFEGGTGNPEKSKKLGFAARIRLAAAIMAGSMVGVDESTTKPEMPNEIRSGEPPKPGEIPFPEPPPPTGLKNA